MLTKLARRFTDVTAVKLMTHHHQTLRVTPAMEACIADHVWSIQENCGTLELRRKPCLTYCSPSLPSSCCSESQR